MLDIIFISGFQKRMQGGDACGFNRTDVYMCFNTAKTEQKEVSISFLGIVATPHKVAKVMGLCRLSNEILGGLQGCGLNGSAPSLLAQPTLLGLQLGVVRKKLGVVQKFNVVQTCGLTARRGHGKDSAWLESSTWSELGSQLGVVTEKTRRG